MDDKKKKPGFAENMSASQRRRNRIIKAKEEQAAFPETLADQAPRGPLQVRNQVIGILRQSPTGGVVIPDPSFRSTDYGAIDIDKNHLNGAPFNMVVVCEVLNPNCDRGVIDITIGKDKELDTISISFP